MSAVPAPSPAPPKKSGNLVLKIILGVLGLFALVTVLAVGSCVYIGYRVKQKADQVQKAYEQAKASAATGAQGQNPQANIGKKMLGALSQNPQAAANIGKALGALGQGQAGGAPDLGKILGALSQALPPGGGGGETRPAGSCPSGDQKTFDDYAKAAASASIPLEPGLTLTDIWSPGAGSSDIEILHTVKALHSTTIETTGMRLVGNSSESTRNLCIADLLKAHEYESGFGTNVPDTMPGATMFSLSEAEFNDLKAGRPTAFTYYEARNGSGGTYVLNDFSKGTLNRVEPADVAYSAIVNGATKELPTIHAKGDLTNMPVEAWVLDDAANPLVLNFKATNSSFHITYVKITFPEKKQIEQQLATAGRAEIYGIYFDFNKATPRPESAPVLKEIATALKDNPAWKLKIEGHTDNIGGDAYNLKLSQQRAEGVMQALVTQYGIAVDRLTAKGYGASRPKATNATVEGRALNRRVELVRE